MRQSLIQLIQEEKKNLCCKRNISDKWNPEIQFKNDIFYVSLLNTVSINSL